MGKPKAKTETKTEQYIRQSEEAAANIATWPAWMQHNLTPPTVTVPDPEPMTAEEVAAHNRAWSAAQRAAQRRPR